MLLLSASKNIVPIKSYATFKSSKFATLPQDYPSPLNTQDINECEEVQLYCDEISTDCSNTLGSYKCTCPVCGPI